MASIARDIVIPGRAKREPGISRFRVWSFGPSRNDEALDLDFGTELDDLPGWHAEERSGAFGIALQEREHVLPPHPHARDIFARDDGLAANVIGDIGEIDAGQLALLAGEF